MPKIQHLLVLMLENRSFDHMLGFLSYPPDVAFEGLHGLEQTVSNPLPDGGKAFPEPNASFLIEPGPDHSHEAVMMQLLGDEIDTRPYSITNSGFCTSYDSLKPGHGSLAMQCFTPESLPVLSTLGQGFAVCDHWFCSVPGATWPNRNFAHAANSDGQVNIKPRAYSNRTIFEQLSAAGRDWAVYYGGFPPQAMAFTRLWNTSPRNWLQRFKPINSLYRAIQHDHLPHYAFIEPDMLGKTSDSQHPGTGGEMDFRAAERLIWRIYTFLRENPAVFQKTLFLITYDEHGGFFDHVPPPHGPELAVEPPYSEPDTDYTFSFDLLGPRVPAVLVSPWIPAGTVDQTIYDHASIPATVRKVFAVTEEALTARDRRANTFEQALTLDSPRQDLPVLPEPFVDEAVRNLVTGLELSDSLAWIIRDLIPQTISRQPRPLPGGLGIGETGFGLSGLEPAEVQAAINAQILEDIGPQLSEEARQVIMTPEDPPAVAPQEGVVGSGFALGGSQSVLGRFVRVIRLKIERLLENRSLVDDAMLVADWFVRKFEDRNIILRTMSDRSIEQPGKTVLRQALRSLFNTSDPQARVWLSDHHDRWLTVFGDRRATFHDRDPDGVFFLERITQAGVLRLFESLEAGDLAAVRSVFQSGLGTRTIAHQSEGSSSAGNS